MKFVLANWKASLSPAAAERWLADFTGAYRAVSGIQVILAVPSLILSAVQEKCRNLQGISLAAQDVSPFPPGGYTGSIPAAWLQGLAEYVLVGHRERRRYFHETIQDAANKVSEAIDADIRPILCIDPEDIRQQLTAIKESELAQVTLALTPAEADQLEVARSREAISAEARRFADLSGGCPVLYGGGVNAANVADLISIPGLAGVMAAKGSLDPRKFIALLDAAGRALAGD